MVDMAKRKQSTQPSAQAEVPPTAVAGPVLDDQAVFGSNLSLHDLFQQQALAALERTDLSEQAKQEILVAMACPCCGGSAMSYTVKLKR